MRATLGTFVALHTLPTLYTLSALETVTSMRASGGPLKERMAWKALRCTMGHVKAC